MKNERSTIVTPIARSTELTSRGKSPGPARSKCPIWYLNEPSPKARATAMRKSPLRRWRSFIFRGSHTGPGCRKPGEWNLGHRMPDSRAPEGPFFSRGPGAAGLAPGMSGTCASGARLALGIHPDRRARRRHHLHAVLAAAELVRDIPVFGLRLASRLAAALDVPGLRARIAPAHVGSDHAAGDRPAGRRDVVAAAVADLVADDPADQGARDRAGHVHVAALRNALVLRPAPAPRLGDDGMHGSHVRIEEALTAASMVVVHRRGRRPVARGVDALARAHGAQRRQAVVHPHGGKRRI